MDLKNHTERLYSSLNKPRKIQPYQLQRSHIKETQ